jgi:ubiquinone/menaquinone biosynthesis C-methylase UbiE
MNSTDRAGKLEKISKAYDSPTWWYDLRGFLILTFSYRDTLWSQIRFFAGNLSPRHLEVAVGTGTLSKLCIHWRAILRRKSPKPAGVAFDYAPSMLKGAARKYRRSPDWKVEIADVTHLPYADEQFETANVANAFHCFPEPELAFRELHRVLRPSGTLALNVLSWPDSSSLSARLSQAINRWGIRKGILYSPYDPARIRSMAEEGGFEIVQEARHGFNTYWLLRKP